MGDFVYKGEHSINFKVENEEDEWRNTWDTWKLAPSTRPVVNPPEPKKEYVDVPGADGSIDYTEALTEVRYQNRTGSWTFLIDNGFWDWPVLYTEFMSLYQGKQVCVQLTDDPDYYYIGRIEVNQFNQNKDYSSFVINYTLEPFKYPIDSFMNRWWLWNELYGTPSYFGPFKVDGFAERHILNPSKKDTVEVYYGATDTMGLDLYRYQRSGGENIAVLQFRNKDIEPGERIEPYIFTLAPGEVVLVKVYGTGIISFDCGSGKRL